MIYYPEVTFEIAPYPLTPFDYGEVGKMVIDGEMLLYRRKWNFDGNFVVSAT